MPAANFAFKPLLLTVLVNDLVKGKQIQCKNIVELLAFEDRIKEACRTFKAILSAAAGFGGEEVVTI